jgi:adenine-specific DNA-methyltransferase
VKYIRLESYEDALDNLQLRERTGPQQQLLAASREAREDYMLSYMLDVETKGSASLLNIEQFKDPFNYKLKVTRNNETKIQTVDLVETFNYLIGLHVEHMAARVHRTAEFERDEHGRLQIKGKTKPCEAGEGWTFRVIQGRSPNKDRVLVIWRVLTGDPEQDNLMLDTFCKKMGFSTKDMEFDLIYVNGDNNLENLRRDEDTWKVQLIEEHFHRLMFDVRDV